MAPETIDDLELLRDAAREVAEAEKRRAPATTSKVRFGARAGFRGDDGLSTKPAPAPRGPDTAALIEDAKRRRREREREGEGR